MASTCCSAASATPNANCGTACAPARKARSRDFGADDAFPITDIDDILPGLIEGRDRVYSAMGSNPEFDRHLMDWINVIRSKAHLGAQPPNEFVALDHLLHDMRLYKSAAEVKVMREAARISAQAHIRAMQASRAGLHEFSLEAELDYEFRKGGAKMPAYGSIVAAGRNSCILHYQQNDALLKDGDLVLIDAGCEIDCYASDITRTWPVNGKYSRPNRKRSTSWCSPRRKPRSPKSPRTSTGIRPTKPRCG